MTKFLADLGWVDLNFTTSLFVDWIGLFVIVIFIAWLGNFIAKRYLVRTFQKLMTRFKRNWSETVLKYKVATKVSHFIPALIIRHAAPLFEQEGYPISETIVAGVVDATTIFILLNLALVLNACLRSFEDIYETFAISNRKPIRTYSQVARIVLFSVIGISIIAKLMNISPWTFLTGMSAATAVIVLIFKDSILGFVASIQLASHDVIRIGDWIEMPAFGADGDVFEINLNTIKVRNFDKTISTVPTSAMLTSSVKNWRGMTESGGRRIKRSLNIDLESIKFCDNELLDKLSKISLLKDHLQKKQKLVQASEERLTTTSEKLTNVGLFRAYILQYLRHSEHIHNREDGYLFLIRQLQPNDLGLPIELYVFTNKTDFVTHEAIQADIFDHLFATLPIFELRPFQGSVVSR